MSPDEEISVRIKVLHELAEQVVQPVDRPYLGDTLSVSIWLEKQAAALEKQIQPS
jgi:hypothetical protein